MNQPSIIGVLACGDGSFLHQTKQAFMSGMGLEYGNLFQLWLLFNEPKQVDKITFLWVYVISLKSTL